jgi:hypothetical protein
MRQYILRWLLGVNVREDLTLASNLALLCAEVTALKARVTMIDSDLSEEIDRLRDECSQLCVMLREKGAL